MFLTSGKKSRERKRDKWNNFNTLTLQERKNSGSSMGAIGLIGEDWMNIKVLPTSALTLSSLRNIGHPCHIGRDIMNDCLYRLARVKETRFYAFGFRRTAR